MEKEKSENIHEESSEKNMKSVKKKSNSSKKRQATTPKPRARKKGKKGNAVDTELPVSQQILPEPSLNNTSEGQNTIDEVFNEPAIVTEHSHTNTQAGEFDNPTEQKSEAVAESDNQISDNTVQIPEDNTFLQAEEKDSTAALNENVLPPSVPEFPPSATEHNTVHHKKEQVSSSESLLQIAVFTLGKYDYGIDIMKIREIIKPPHITKVPSVPSFIEGVINLRGIIMPVLNLRKKMNLPDKEIDKLSRIIVIEHNNSVVGFIVDSVKEVLRVPTSIVEKADAFNEKGEENYIQGLIKLESGLVLLLNTEAALRFEQENSELK